MGKEIGGYEKVGEGDELRVDEAVPLDVARLSEHNVRFWLLNYNVMK